MDKDRSLMILAEATMLPKKIATTLQTVMPPGHEINQSFVTHVYNAAMAGSATKNRYSLQESEDIEAARTTFWEALKVKESESPIGTAFTRLHRYRGNVVNPAGALASMLVLQELSGNAGASIMKEPMTLSTSAQTLVRRDRYIRGALGLLGWEGDFTELYADVPRLFLLADKRLAVLARLAATHGSEADRNLTVARIGSMARVDVEQQIIAKVVEGRDFGVRKAKPAKTPQSTEILYQLASDDTQRQLIGERLLRAYFVYRPAPAVAIASYPNLLMLQTEKTQQQYNKEQTPKITYIRGDEPWLVRVLDESPHDNKRRFLRSLNLCATRGTADMRGWAESAESDSRIESIVAYRQAFFAMLGWSTEGHPYYEGFMALAKRRPLLISPAKCIEILNILDEHNVTDTVLRKNFSVIATSAKATADRLEKTASRPAKPD